MDAFGTRSLRNGPVWKNGLKNEIAARMQRTRGSNLERLSNQPKNRPLDLSIAIHSEGTFVELRADSKVAGKWNNGHYAMGQRYKDNGGIQIRGRRRKLFTPQVLIDDNVKHPFKEHKKEADHFLKLGIVGQKLKRSREQGGMERDVRVLGRKHQKTTEEVDW